MDHNSLQTNVPGGGSVIFTLRIPAVESGDINSVFNFTRSSNKGIRGVNLQYMCRISVNDQAHVVVSACDTETPWSPAPCRITVCDCGDPRGHNPVVGNDRYRKPLSTCRFRLQEVQEPVDSFTASLHSTNGGHLPAVRAMHGDNEWPLKNVGNPHMIPECNVTEGSPNLYLDWPIKSGRPCPVPTDSPQPPG